jgi:hypothetical protein
MRVLAVAVLSACGAALEPVVALPPTAMVGCLEMSVERAPVASALVLHWRVTNVCDHAVPIDLGLARVVAIGPLFARTHLLPDNPHGQLAPGWLEAGETDFITVPYIPHVTGRDVAIEVELDALFEQSHRPVVLQVLPAPLRAVASRPPEDVSSPLADY